MQQFPDYSLLQTLALPPCSLSLSIWIAILYILYSACPCPQSNCQRMSSYSRQSSTSSNVSTSGTSSFQVGRERQRQPEMELFRWVEILFWYIVCLKIWLQNHGQVSSRTRFCRQNLNIPSKNKDLTTTVYLCIYLCIYYKTAIVNKPITNWAVWRQLFPTAVSISLFFDSMSKKKKRTKNFINM